MNRILDIFFMLDGIRQRYNKMSGYAKQQNQNNIIPQGKYKKLKLQQAKIHNCDKTIIDSI